MRKQVFLFIAVAVLGAAVGYSFTQKSQPVKRISPKCAQNCSKTQKSDKASGLFIIDSYSGSL